MSRRDMIREPFRPRTAAEEMADEMAAKMRAEGRAARWLGLPVDQCPIFQVEDWAIMWRAGWREMDEEMKR